MCVLCCEVIQGLDLGFEGVEGSRAGAGGAIRAEARVGVGAGAGAVECLSKCFIAPMSSP